jgi:hypothetical protein
MKNPVVAFVVGVIGGGCVAWIVTAIPLSQRCTLITSQLEVARRQLEASEREVDTLLAAEARNKETALQIEKSLEKVERMQKARPNSHAMILQGIPKTFNDPELQEIFDEIRQSIERKDDGKP